IYGWDCKVIDGTAHVADPYRLAVVIGIVLRTGQAVEHLWLFIIAPQHAKHGIEGTIFQHQDNEVVDLAEPRLCSEMSKHGRWCYGRTCQRAGCELQEITTPHGSPPNQYSERLALSLSQGPRALAAGNK